MEPNKLEASFKEQLNSREIKPSEMAWNKLDAMLTDDEKLKAKFRWMYIAASVLGFLLIGTIYFNQNKDETRNQKIEVVIKDSGTQKNNEKPLNELNPHIGNMYDGTVIKNNLAKAQKKSAIKEAILLIKNNSNQDQIIAVSIDNKKTEQKSIKLQTSNVTVDELLAVAGNPSKKEGQLNSKQVVKVNASNLLLQVDGELDLTFREKVIGKLSKNYQTVKVALSNRNLE